MAVRGLRGGRAGGGTVSPCRINLKVGVPFGNGVSKVARNLLKIQISGPDLGDPYAVGLQSRLQLQGHIR